MIVFRAWAPTWTSHHGWSAVEHGKVPTITRRTVAIMMYAQVLVDLQVECDTFLALWSSEEEGLRALPAANNDCEHVCPRQRAAVLHQHGHDGHLVACRQGKRRPLPTMPGLDPTLTTKSRTSPSPACSTTSIATSSRRPWTFESKAVMEPVDQHWDDHYNLVMDVHEDTFGVRIT